MSFFANLLGGAMQGFGAGVSAMGADEERLAQQRALIQERSQAALDLQRQRAEDRLYQQEQLLQMKSELGGGGSGGGGKGINLAQLAMQAKTPEEQQRVISLARTFAGDDAGALMAEQLYGRAQTTAAPATAGDFARYDRAGDMEAAPPRTTLERASYDADRGRQALQRAYTLFLDPGKTDDFAKGERQFGLNDFGAAVAEKTMRRGGSLEDAATGFSQYSSPKDETAKNELAQQRIAATRERTAATDANADANRKSAERRKLQDLLVKAQGAKEDVLNPNAKADKAAAVSRIQAQLDALDSGQWMQGAAPPASSPTSQVRRPADAAKAFKYQPGSVVGR